MHNRGSVLGAYIYIYIYISALGSRETEFSWGFNSTMKAEIQFSGGTEFSWRLSPNSHGDFKVSSVVAQTIDWPLRTVEHFW